MAVNRTARFVTERLGVAGSWASLARIAAWAVVWTLVISVALTVRQPSYADREFDPDIPPSERVRYVGPTSMRDYGGFLPPPDDPAAFTVAWIGGSEVKLFNVSVPGTFTARVAAVGGRPLVVDTYSVIAPRPIDVVRAVETATANGADAIVVALNPAWTQGEWAVRGWPNTDVSNPLTLLRRASTVSWGLALTSPADVGWKVSRELLPVVAAQSRLNGYASDELDRLDILRDPPDDAPPAVTGDPRLPDDTTGFWLVQEYGPEILTVEDERVRAIMEGIGASDDAARFFARVLLDEVSDAGVPAFLYATAASPESFRDPEFVAAADRVEAFWRDLAGENESPLVEIEPRSITRDFDIEGLFYDTVHMRDPNPFVDVLAERLCAQWRATDPSLECR
jgi:hypothetical protein